ncbi:MAG TPA: NAD(P)-dependent oxidoreductase [Tenuifilaceae bacterium]|nr:NAD(P)-dependent oxidoreductase [Tenuifilaceae bacterium]
MKIVFAEPIGVSKELRESFNSEMQKMGNEVKYFDNPISSQNELGSRIEDAEVIVLANYPLSIDAIKRAKKLKFISVAFTGVDHIPLDYCRENNIKVSNAAGYSTRAVAELAISLAISLLRNVLPLDASTRKGQTRNGFLGRELYGKTFGIVGFGNIGQKVAMLASAFGCKVVVNTRTERNGFNVEYMSIEDLFKVSDIISLHVPANKQTAGLVNQRLISLMKPDSILINTARGAVVDYNALAAALKNGLIAAAAIDVYEKEPPLEASHPILSAPNTILLPHVGYATKEAIAERAEIVVTNIKSWLEGKTQNAVI